MPVVCLCQLAEGCLRWRLEGGFGTYTARAHQRLGRKGREKGIRDRLIFADEVRKPIELWNSKEMEQAFKPACPNDKVGRGQERGEEDTRVRKAWQ